MWSKVAQHPVQTIVSENWKKPFKNPYFREIKDHGFLKSYTCKIVEVPTQGCESLRDWREYVEKHLRLHGGQETHVVLGQTFE